jgi:hypothetical protein
MPFGSLAEFFGVDGPRSDGKSGGRLPRGDERARPYQPARRQRSMRARPPGGLGERTIGYDEAVTNRPDETWHRLREWTYGQTQSERLAAQILISESYADLDPSHPLGGRDGGRDALTTKGGKSWVMAAYFPRGQQTPGAIRSKFLTDLLGVAANKADALAFVTNQELTITEREALKEAAGVVPVELYHLERITTILDAPGMARVRQQFLGIDAADGQEDVASAFKQFVAICNLPAGADGLNEAKLRAAELYAHRGGGARGQYFATLAFQRYVIGHNQLTNQSMVNALVDEVQSQMADPSWEPLAAGVAYEWLSSKSRQMAGQGLVPWSWLVPHYVPRPSPRFPRAAPIVNRGVQNPTEATPAQQRAVLAALSRSGLTPRKRGR